MDERIMPWPVKELLVMPLSRETGRHAGHAAGSLTLRLRWAGASSFPRMRSLPTASISAWTRNRGFPHPERLTS